ncbi:bromo adjacent homology domain-containing 1 protein [Chanos chanos]|uniref:Bromo adjacent homology domain-containing 1 protein n=1 Tax=Chanos chanos TaxID=29144 RepID=A0A6J2VW56_CHACN|nr:bromo adjacent homology domain-containing 1 protein [Chanos chanos]
MTHAGRKGSLCRYQSESRAQVGCQTHAETMGRGWPECPLPEKKAKGRPPKKNGGKEVKNSSSEQDRKLYPLRRRQGMGEVDARNCRVVLTRLEETETQSAEGSGSSPKSLSKGNKKLKNRLDQTRVKPCKYRKKSGKPCRVSPEPKNPKLDESALCTASVFEPRKRRLASLNAEAVNSLLLDREDPQQASRLSKKPPQSPKGECSLSKDVAKNGDSMRKGPDGRKRWRAGEMEQCGRSKKQKKTKSEAEGLDHLSLNSPAPRRLAGLNAAALLKLTSTSSGAKRRGKTEGKPGVGGARGKLLQAKSCRQKQHNPHHQSVQQLSQRCCDLCKKAFHTEALWEGTAGSHGFIRQGYQCSSLLGYSLKPVKEEKTETDVNPCYCCSQERSVEYCHRLALLLGTKAYSEPEERSVSSVKGFLPSPHALSHPTLTIGAHPYPCYPGYYVHIAHHGASSPPISKSPPAFAPSSVTPITLCPSGVQRPKLLPSPVSHAAGIPHPAFCSSVGTCYGDPCRIGTCAYRAAPTLMSRSCSYQTGCSSCSRKIKTEDCSYPLEEHSPSIPVSPALPHSVCPIPSVPQATQSVPHLQPPLSDASQPQGQLRVMRECPQSAKPPGGSRSAVGSSALCPHIKQSQLVPSQGSVAAKQPKISRRRATNGWLPIGMPTEKEVFIVGEESPALRQCYEGVQRDGEIIRVRDTVLLRSGPRKKSLPYVAKVSAFWEDPDSGELMISLFWYYRPEHTQGGRIPSMHCENEIFASRHQDENSVACIEDKCYVLTLAQYCRFCALVKRQEEGLPKSVPMVPPSQEYAVPAHRRVPENVDPELVFVCRHVYDFRYGRLLKNLQ